MKAELQRLTILHERAQWYIKEAAMVDWHRINAINLEIELRWINFYDFLMYRHQLIINEINEIIN